MRLITIHIVVIMFLIGDISQIISLIAILVILCNSFILRDLCNSSRTSSIRLVGRKVLWIRIVIGVSFYHLKGLICYLADCLVGIIAIFVCS